MSYCESLMIIPSGSPHDGNSMHECDICLNKQCRDGTCINVDVRVLFCGLQIQVMERSNDACCVIYPEGFAFHSTGMHIIFSRNSKPAVECFMGL
uniref:Uncharacterized protein n=1 Tax=Arundo donax TaxID=35708 RepID=A0A0A9GF75_ARUDO